MPLSIPIVMTGYEFIVTGIRVSIRLKANALWQRKAEICLLNSGFGKLSKFINPMLFTPIISSAFQPAYWKYATK
jgi:hypothetical protein